MGHKEKHLDLAATVTRKTFRGRSETTVTVDFTDPNNQDPVPMDKVLGLLNEINNIPPRSVSTLLPNGRPTFRYHGKK